MSLEFPTQEVQREGFAFTRYNQLTRLVAVDILFSEVVSERNQAGFNLGERTSPDAIKVLKETQSLLRLSIFNTRTSLIDLGSPLALSGLAFMQAGRGFQNGQLDTVMIGDNKGARGNIEGYLTRQMGNDYENAYFRAHGERPPID